MCRWGINRAKSSIVCGDLDIRYTRDVLIAAIYGTFDPNQIQANIIAYFDPQVVSIGGSSSADRFLTATPVRKMMVRVCHCFPLADCRHIEGAEM